MKRISRLSLGFIAGFLICVPTFAGQATLIYGLENAANVQGNATRQYYIRAGSFKNKTNAKQFQKVLRAKLGYTVKYSYQNHFYIITIGPVPSAAKVRDVAHQVLASAKVTPVVPVPKKPVLAEPTKPASESLLSGTTNETEQVHLPEPLQPASAMVLKPSLPVNTAAPIKKRIEQPIVTHAVSIHHEIYKDQGANTFTKQLWNGQFAFTGGFGEQWSHFDSDMYVNNDSGAAPPYDRDRYTTTQNLQPFVLASLAYRIDRDAEWLPAYSFGLQYQHDFSANVDGKVLQYSSPAFYNYNYSWSVASDIFMLIGKLNIFKYRFVSPYLHAGVGLAFNYASNYSEAPTVNVSAPRLNPAFESNTTMQFAYGIGAGIDFDVAKNVIVSAQYQYQNLGNVQSGRGSNGWSAQSLNLGTYSANAVLLSVSYLFDNPF